MARLSPWSALLLAACGGPSVSEEAAPAAPPTSIPVAAANASGARFPQPPLAAPPSSVRRPPTLPTPADPFGFPPEMLDAGPPTPPPKKKGTHL